MARNRRLSGSCAVLLCSLAWTPTTWRVQPFHSSLQADFVCGGRSQFDGDSVRVLTFNEAVFRKPPECYGRSLQGRLGMDGHRVIYALKVMKSNSALADSHMGKAIMFAVCSPQTAPSDEGRRYFLGLRVCGF